MDQILQNFLALIIVKPIINFAIPYYLFLDASLMRQLKVDKLKSYFKPLIAYLRKIESENMEIFIKKNRIRKYGNLHTLSALPHFFTIDCDPFQAIELLSMMLFIYKFITNGLQRRIRKLVSRYRTDIFDILGLLSYNYSLKSLEYLNRIINNNNLQQKYNQNRTILSHNIQMLFLIDLSAKGNLNKCGQAKELLQRLRISFTLILGRKRRKKSPSGHNCQPALNQNKKKKLKRISDVGKQQTYSINNNYSTLGALPQKYFLNYYKIINFI